VESDPGQVPLATVAITAYNYERFVARAGDSALAMDWPAGRLEVLVVDDGSTDATPDVLAAYGGRIRVIRTENRGVAAAVSSSLAAARGEIIALLAADDECRPDRLRRQWAVLHARPEVGLVYSDMEIVDAAGATVHPSFARAMGLVCRSGPGLLAPLLAGNCVSGGPMLLRAVLRDRLLPMPDGAVHEDWWIALKAAERSEIAYVDEPLYRYRHHGANMNLGAPPDRVTELYRRELPFRRALLSGELVGLSNLTTVDLAPAAARLDAVARHVAEADGRPVHDVLGLTEADREAAGTAMAAADPVRAFALDPAHADARAALGLVCAAPPPLDVRARVTIALVADVLADPGLLDAYLATTGAEDDATLVLYAPGGDAQTLLPVLGARVPALLAADAPDVLIHALPASLPAERALFDRADAVLTRRAPAPV
jgi:hypothetical protein